MNEDDFQREFLKASSIFDNFNLNNSYLESLNTLSDTKDNKRLDGRNFHELLDYLIKKDKDLNSRSKIITGEFKPEIVLSEEDEKLLDKLHFFIVSKGEDFKNKLKQRLQ